MQKRAFEIEPKNKLYEWAYLFSYEDAKAQHLKTEIKKDDYYLDWLKTKGFPGTYILESL